MLYSYAEFPGKLIVTHTQLLKRDGKEIVEVNFELPTNGGFSEARYSLPDFKEVFNDGFTPSETERNLKILRNNKEIILDAAKAKKVKDA